MARTMAMVRFPAKGHCLPSRPRLFVPDPLFVPSKPTPHVSATVTLNTCTSRELGRRQRMYGVVLLLHDRGFDFLPRSIVESICASIEAVHSPLFPPYLLHTAYLVGKLDRNRTCPYAHSRPTSLLLEITSALLLLTPLLPFTPLEDHLLDCPRHVEPR